MSYHSFHRARQSVMRLRHENYTHAAHFGQQETDATRSESQTQRAKLLLRQKPAEMASLSKCKSAGGSTK